MWALVQRARGRACIARGGLPFFRRRVCRYTSLAILCLSHSCLCGGPWGALRRHRSRCARLLEGGALVGLAAPACTPWTGMWGMCMCVRPCSVHLHFSTADVAAQSLLHALLQTSWVLHATVITQIYLFVSIHEVPTELIHSMRSPHALAARTPHTYIRQGTTHRPKMQAARSHSSGKHSPGQDPHFLLKHTYLNISQSMP
eukprot:1139852-Pelagomonas_calceolata.AAC.2